jgi:hypothetical protein
MARRLNVPMDVLNTCIHKLESPDIASRDPSHDGRRLLRLDEHRDWGWRIVNWEKYEKVRTRADAADRVARHRNAKTGDVEDWVLEKTQDQRVVDAWRRWVQHRREKRCAITPQTAQKQLAMVDEIGIERFIAAIDHSIRQGWQGIYEPKASQTQVQQPSKFEPSLQSQKQELDKLILSHPANKESLKSVPNPTQEQRDDLKALRERLGVVSEKIARAGMQK